MNDVKIRFLGIISVIGAILGLIISLPYASAWGYYTGTAPQWVMALRPLMRPFHSFSDLPTVYTVYAHLFLICALGQWSCVHSLYLLRRQDKNKCRKEKWGLHLTYWGTILSVMGVFTDGWTGGPPGFFAVIISTPIVGIGMIFLSQIYQRAKMISKLEMGILTACSLLSLPFSLLVFHHTPTGQLLLMHIVWLLLGWKVWFDEEFIKKMSSNTLPIDRFR